MSPGAPVAALEAGAEGDLDGNGILSDFARTGSVNTTTQQLVVATIVFIHSEYE